MAWSLRHLRSRTGTGNSVEEGRGETDVPVAPVWRRRSGERPSVARSLRSGGASKPSDRRPRPRCQIRRWPEKAQRRRFTAEFKLQVLREVDRVHGARVESAPCFGDTACTRHCWPRGVASATRGALRQLGTQARAKAQPRNPLCRPRRRARARERAAAEPASAGRDHHRGPKKTLRDPGDPPADPRQRRRATDGRRPGTAPGRRHGASGLCGLGVPRATLYRRRRPQPRRHRDRRPTPARASSAQERQQVLDVLHSEPFADKAPAEVYASSAGRGAATSARSARCTASWTSTQEVRERRDQLRHPTYHKPQLLATAPNQVWSWDITKLLGPAKWTYFHLYVILDIFSRYVVGWMLASRESEHLAERLIRETWAQAGHRARPADDPQRSRAAMRSQTVAQLLATWGSPSPTAGRTSPTTTRSRRASSRRSSTGRSSPTASARTKHALDFCRHVLPLVEPRASPLGARPADAGRRSTSVGPTAVLAERQRVLDRRLRRPPRALRPRPAATACDCPPPSGYTAPPGLDIHHIGATANRRSPVLAELAPALSAAPHRATENALRAKQREARDAELAQAGVRAGGGVSRGPDRGQRPDGNRLRVFHDVGNTAV